jgi:GT2 family glycosyltransferase
MSRELESTEVTVSIIVVNWNKSELTKTCLDHIRANTGGISYEVLVVDNGSEAHEINKLRGICECYEAKTIELNQNMYFGEANNIAAEAARGEMLLFLNNDVFVSEGYLQPLIYVLKGGYRAGAVGPKFSYPDGRLQEAGAYLRPDGWSIQHGKHNPPTDAISKNGPYIVDYCSAACLLMQRDVFLNAGGFDPLFDPAYFEDADLMLRLRSRGLFTYLCTDVAVVHHENTTSREVWDAKRFEAISLANHQKFVSRWGDYIGRRLFEDIEMPRFEEIPWSPEPLAAFDSNMIVLQGHGPIRPSPQWTEIIVLASQLADGFCVAFAADEACSRCRIFTLASNAGVELGNFKIIRASDVKSGSEYTVAVMRESLQKTIELVSVSGPHANDVKIALQAINWS